MLARESAIRNVEAVENCADPNVVDDCTRIRRLFRLLAVGLAIVEAYVARNTMNPDSRSYLDLARAYLRHDWAATFNAYWSPLYTWFLALTLGLFQPSLRWEYPLIHAMNVVVFLGCLASFEFFWSGLIRCSGYQSILPTSVSHESKPLTPQSLWVLGYSLFIWMTIGPLISLVNPDLCVATLVWLIAGIVIRLRATQSDVWIWRIGFGLALGFGYLAKSIMFPAGFVFVLASLTEWRGWRNWLRVGIAVLTFLLVAAPEIILLSREKGRLTFSDTGKLNYAWYNYSLPIRNWQGVPSSSGIPLHPTRKIHDAPTVFEFNGPVVGSYPPWQDPSYWNDGIRPKFNVRMVARYTLNRVGRLLGMLAQPKLWLIGMVLILLGSDPRHTAKGVKSYWDLILPATAVLVAYALVAVEFRYLPPWTILVWGAILFSIRTRGSFAGSTVYQMLPWLVAFCLISAIAYGAYGQWRHGRDDDATPEYATAEGLQQLGIYPGAKVGAIGFDNDAHWAYLARVSVVAEINSNEECAFWSASPSVQSEVLKAFASAGAGAIVANAGGAITSTGSTPALGLKDCARPDGGWHRLKDSPNLVYILKER